MPKVIELGRGEAGLQTQRTGSRLSALTPEALTPLRHGAWDSSSTSAVTSVPTAMGGLSGSEKETLTRWRPGSVSMTAVPVSLVR